MAVLVDTHAWLWMHGAPDRLSGRARGLLEDPRTELMFSSVSAWEIAIKHALGKLRLPRPPRQYVPARLTDDGLTVLPVHVDHALLAGELPPRHRDPFDRLLVAQALVEKVPLVTADDQVRAYEQDGLRILW